MTEFAARGTIFSIEIGTGGTYTDVAQVRGIGGPSLAADPLDVSAHDDGARFYRDFIQGFHDPGEVTLELLFEPALVTQGDFSEGLLGLYDSGEVHHYRVIWPTTGADTWDFDGIVVGYEPDAPHDDALVATVTIKLVGAPVFN